MCFFTGEISNYRHGASQNTRKRYTHTRPYENISSAGYYLTTGLRNGRFTRYFFSVLIEFLPERLYERLCSDRFFIISPIEFA